SSRAAQPGIFQRLVSRLLPFPLAAGCTRDPQAAPVSAAIGASISWFPYYLRILDKLSFMLDLAFLRNNLEAVEARLSRRGGSAGLERFRELDRERRAAITQVERLKALRNAGSEEVARARREGRDTTEQQARLRELGEQIRLLEEKSKEYDGQLQEILATIPNVPHDSVPAGSGSEQNVEIRRWGRPKLMDFTPKAHWDLGPALGILDFDRAAKITGARFAVYWGLGARLERALMNFMLDVHTGQHGYTEVLPPFI